MNKQSLTKIAGAADVIMKILQVISIVAASVCAVFIPLTLIFGEKVIADASNLSMGSVVLHLTGSMTDYIDIPAIKLYILLTLVIGIVFSIALWYFIKVLRRILAPMKEGNPFELGVSDNIRRLAWTALAVGIIDAVGNVVSSIFELRAYDLKAIFSNPAIASFVLKPDLNVWPTVIMVVVLFLLSAVFKYGEMLQTESDETL